MDAKTKSAIIGISAGVIGFMTVRYLFNKKNVIEVKSSARGNFVNCICNGQGYRIAGTNCDSFNEQCHSIY